MVVNGVAAVIFLCCLTYAGYALWDNWSILDGSENALKTMVEYKPDEEEGLSYNFSQLMAMNPDVCGWIVMDHTGIDYPIVQGDDNFEYLDKDALGNPEISGSIFLDWQNNRKFTDPYMVLMGHHMQAGKMFGDLDKYSDETFFQKNTTGKIYLPDRVLYLETAAFLTVDAYDKYIYRTQWDNVSERQELLKRIYEQAQYTTGEELTTEDQMIALSTCSTSGTNARHVLVCRIVHSSASGKEVEKYMWRRKMNEKMRGINIQEKASMCGKCKMWLVMVVFALISTAMLSSVKIHAASAEENQMADIETNHVTAVENTQEQITVNIPVKLKITGNSQQNEIFSFLLKQNDEQSPMPKISKVQITGTKKDAFQIQYEKPGVYRYTISEVAGDGKNWIYDQSEYSLEVYIMRNEQTDTLQSLIIAYNAKGEKVDPVFMNRYQAPEAKQKSMTVKTGDSADIKTLTGLMLICGGIMIGTYEYKKKIEKK